jgi:adenylosuccinate lyase
MGGLVHSQRVLLALTQAGSERDDSYRLVQRNAMKVWESDGQLSCSNCCKADPEVTAAMSARSSRRSSTSTITSRRSTRFLSVFGE